MSIIDVGGLGHPLCMVTGSEIISVQKSLNLKQSCHWIAPVLTHGSCVHKIPIILMEKSHISVASVYFLILGEMVQHFEPYIRMG